MEVTSSFPYLLLLKPFFPLHHPFYPLPVQTHHLLARCLLLWPYKPPLLPSLTDQTTVHSSYRPYLINCSNASFHTIFSAFTNLLACAAHPVLIEGKEVAYWNNKSRKRRRWVWYYRLNRYQVVRTRITVWKNMIRASASESETPSSPFHQPRDCFFLFSLPPRVYLLITFTKQIAN